MAALITEATGLPVDITVGSRSEFSVWVNDTLVAKKSSKGFQADDEIVAAVRQVVGAR